MAKNKNKKAKISQAVTSLPTAAAVKPEAHAPIINADQLESAVTAALAQMKNGNHDAARNALEQILKENPSHRSALEAMGRLHMARQEFDSAVDVHNRLILYYSNDPRAYNAMGVSLLMAGHLDEALVHLTRCMELEPNNIRYTANLAKALIMRGDFENAQELLEKAFMQSQGTQMAPLLELLDFCQQQAQAR